MVSHVASYQGATSILIAAALTLASVSARSAPARIDAPATGVESVVLKHLPAGHDGLVFRGENSVRTWSIFLGRNEVAAATIFQLALLNTVALLPERSTLKLTINGHAIASVPARSPEKVTLIPVKIPSGVLVPGFNSVQVSVSLTHRVDCSVKATYELWALLDPAQTGFVVPSVAAHSVRSLAEVAGEPLADDGTTRIHVQMNDDASNAEVGRAARFVNALVAHAHLSRPVVDVGPDKGIGPGLDVVLAKGDLPQADGARGVRVITREDGVIIAREPTSNRLVLILYGSDDAELDREVLALENAAPEQNATPEPGQNFVIDGETRKSFSDLGFTGEQFTGRHYVSNLEITLPTDFFPGNYDRARILIDGTHSGTLEPDSEMVFRVNGALVSSLRFEPGTTERYQHQIVDLPLRFFHPGHNDIGMEATTASPSDAQCDLATMPREVRLTVSGSSELEFPHFAHLGTLPQIPAALYGARDSSGALSIYLPDATRQSVSTGLTILANVVAAEARALKVEIKFSPPSAGDPPGIVVGTFDQLPTDLSSALKKIAAPAPAASVDQVTDREAATTEGVSGSSGTGQANLPAPSPMEEAALSNRAYYDAMFRALRGDLQTFLRNQGFFYSSGDTRNSALTLAPNSMLMAAVGPNVSRRSIGGIELPDVTESPAHWFVIAANSAATYQHGIEHLVVNGQWKLLDGQAISLNVDTNELHTVQPSRVTYVVPRQFIASDLPPILGGIVSNNITLSVSLLLLLMSILGLSTHAVIRRMGAGR